MKKIRRNVSLNQRLAGISLAVFIPMILVMTYLLASLTNATSAICTDHKKCLVCQYVCKRF